MNLDDLDIPNEVHEQMQGVSLKIWDRLPSFEAIETHRRVHFITPKGVARKYPVLTLVKFTEEDYEIGQEKPDTTPYQLYNFLDDEDGEKILSYDSYDELYADIYATIPDHIRVDHLFNEPE